jgi:hypothetical protein
MTDEELIEELSEMGRHPCRAHLPMGERLRQASDRIEALNAKNELWRKALEFIALGSIIELDDEDVPVQVWLDDEDMRSIARAALEKQP